jgi:hypothetical protein
MDRSRHWFRMPTLQSARVLLVVLGTIAVSACARTHITKHTNAVAALHHNESVYVAVPQDGRYGDRVYTGSGQMVTRTVQRSFMPSVKHVEVGSEYENLETALASARNTSASYLVYPTILHWEDRATEWSGRRDKVEVAVTVYNVSSGEKISYATINGRSRLISFGGDHGHVRQDGGKARAV